MQSVSTVEDVQVDTSLPPPVPSKRLSPPATSRIDLRFLQNSQSYHQLSTEDVPDAFLKSQHQPGPDANLPDLLSGGHFRRAAESALRQLLDAESYDVDLILSLFYTRLACLVLVSKPDFAADEALPLTDFLSRDAAGSRELLSAIPWELRILLVRLQSIIAADGGRRAIMALYSLAAEVRSHARKDNETSIPHLSQLWILRLTDLAFRVADAFVEMGELETATRHLDSLNDPDADEVNMRKALLRARIGDISGATRSASAIASPERRETIEALVKTADGDWPQAVEAWQAIARKYPKSDFLQQNAAVCMLYAGKLAESREILEDMAHDVDAYPSLLFNLSTVYELCTERAVKRKEVLKNVLVVSLPTSMAGGWERPLSNFKL